MEAKFHIAESCDIPLSIPAVESSACRSVGCCVACLCFFHPWEKFLVFWKNVHRTVFIEYHTTLKQVMIFKIEDYPCPGCPSMSIIDENLAFWSEKIINYLLNFGVVGVGRKLWRIGFSRSCARTWTYEKFAERGTE